MDQDKKGAMDTDQSSLIPGVHITYSEDRTPIIDMLGGVKLPKRTLQEVPQENIEKLLKAYQDGGEKAFDQEWAKLNPEASKTS